MMRIPALFVAIALLNAAACAREPDHAAVANNALTQAGLENVSASYDSDSDVVRVSGTVPTEADRERAGDVVAQAVIPAQVANEITVEGADTEIADDLDSGLSTRLENLIEQDTTLEGASVDFDVRNGVVTITGQVTTPEQKDRIGELARSQPGVRDVVNSLEVKS